jgi:hypothetical protein
MTTIQNNAQRERYKDDFASCPPQISSATRAALEAEGFNAANAFHRHLENFLNDPNCPLIVPVEKLDKGSCFDNLGPTPYSAGIRGQIQDYKDSLNSDSDEYKTAEKFLNGSWDDDNGEVTMNC